MCARRFGFDWAHDVFTFACHMFMYFSCIRTFHSLYSDIDLIGSFLHVSLSLSLSFSLYVLTCSMASKRKSTPSRNPLRSWASSSSFPADSTPSHIRFCDDKARKDFSENFSQRGIHSEHQVILSDFFDTDLPTVIYSRGWESLCGISFTCPYVIIHEFYSNMHGFDYSIPYFVTCVQGTCMVVTLDIISKVLHMPKVEFANYPSCERLRTVSKDELSSRFYKTSSFWGDR